jgi:hypothetical protein
MIFTLTKSLTFSQASEFLLAKVQRAQAQCYRQLMKKVKAMTKKPLVKGLFKFNQALEKSLKKMMKGLHRIEKTALFKFSGICANALIRTVKNDGLTFTILLTSLGYTAWCYFI